MMIMEDKPISAIRILFLPQDEEEQAQLKYFERMKDESLPEQFSKSSIVEKFRISDLEIKTPAFQK